MPTFLLHYAGLDRHLSLGNCRATDVSNEAWRRIRSSSYLSICIRRRRAADQRTDGGSVGVCWRCPRVRLLRHAQASTAAASLLDLGVTWHFWNSTHLKLFQLTFQLSWKFFSTHFKILWLTFRLRPDCVIAHKRKQVYTCNCNHDTEYYYLAAED